jgi:phosphoribosylformylglycinamidine (FGAM) synthase-like amidotransferase family enzyme
VPTPNTPPLAAGRPGHARGLTFDPADNVAAPFLNLSRPKVAILREQGVNSHVEMAYAFTEAGFEAYDVHMTDLQTGRAKLQDFKGVVACGGFSYGDTLGAGIGWARSITFNPVLSEQFQGFFARTDTFGLGVCNGCQMFAELADIIPGAEAWPRFTTNQSERFEARLSMVEVLGVAQPVLAGHGRQPPADCGGARRGLCQLQAPGQPGQGMAAMRFVDNTGAATEPTPFNPNGSPGRPDRRDHRRRPLHRHDAAPRARVPQHPDELDSRPNGSRRARWPSCRPSTPSHRPGASWPGHWSPATVSRSTCSACTPAAAPVPARGAACFRPATWATTRPMPCAPGAPRPPFPGLDQRLPDGAPMDDPLFPLVWS